VSHHQSIEQSPPRLPTQQDEDERRNEFIEKYVVSPQGNRSNQRRESEAKSLIRLHSAAILIQSCVRKFLRKKTYQSGGSGL
jgi:hypothetical protein